MHRFIARTEGADPHSLSKDKEAMQKMTRHQTDLEEYDQILKRIEIENKQDAETSWSYLFFGNTDRERTKKITQEGKAKSLMKHEKFEEAIKFCQEIIGKEKREHIIGVLEGGYRAGSSNIFEILGQCYLKLAERNNKRTLLGDAISHYKCALTRDSSSYLCGSLSRYYANKRIAYLLYKIAKIHFYLGEYKQALEIVNNIIKYCSKTEREYFKSHLVKANTLLALGNFGEANESFAIAKNQKYSKTRFTAKYLHPIVGYFYVKAKSFLRANRYILAKKSLEKAIDAAKINCQGVVPTFLEEDYLQINIACNSLFKKEFKEEKRVPVVLDIARNPVDSPKFYYDIYELLLHATGRSTDLIFFLKSLAENLLMAFWLGDKKAPNELKSCVDHFIPWLQKEHAITEEVTARLKETKKEDKEYAIAQRALFEIHFFTRRAYAIQLNQPYANFKARFEDIRRSLEFLIQACQSYENLKKDPFAKLFELYKCIGQAGNINKEQFDKKCWKVLVDEFLGEEKIPPPEQFVYSGTHAHQFPRQLLYRILSQEEIETLKKEYPFFSDQFILKAQQQFNSVIQHLSIEKTDHNEEKSYCIDITKKLMDKNGVTLFLNKENCEIARVAVISQSVILTGYGHALTINVKEDDLSVRNFIISNISNRDRITKIIGKDLSQLTLFSANVSKLVFDINMNAQQLTVNGNSVCFTKANINQVMIKNYNPIIKSPLFCHSIKLNVKELKFEENCWVQAVYTEIVNEPNIEISGKFQSRVANINANDIELKADSALQLEHSQINITDSLIAHPQSSFFFYHCKLIAEDFVEIHKDAEWVPDTEEHKLTSTMVIKTKTIFKMEGKLAVGEGYVEADEDHWNGEVEIYQLQGGSIPENNINGISFPFTAKSNKGFIKGNFVVLVGRFRRNHLALYGASSFPSFSEFRSLLKMRTTCVSSFPIEENGTTSDPMTAESQLTRIESFSPVGIWLGTKARAANVARYELLGVTFNSNLSRDNSVIFIDIGFSTQGIENAIEDIRNIYQLLRHHNFPAIRQEISAKLQLNNILRWLVWVIRKFLPSLGSIANLAYVTLLTIKQLAVFIKQCRDLIHQHHQKIPIEYVQYLELISTLTPVAQLGIIASSEIPTLCQEDIGLIQPIIPGVSWKDALILGAQLLAPRESYTGIIDTKLGVKQNLFTNYSSISCFEYDLGKVREGISLNISTLIHSHFGGLVISPTVFEQAVVSESGPRLVFADTITEQAVYLYVWDSFWHRYFANTVAINTRNFEEFYKDFLARKGLFENTMAEQRFVKMDSDVNFDKRYESDYEIDITTTSKKPIVINVPIKAPHFSLTSDGNIINYGHIDGKYDVILVSTHGKVIDKGDIEAKGKIILQGDKGVFATASTHTSISHEKHKKYFGLVIEKIDKPCIEVHNPILKSDDVVVFNSPHGPIVITSVTFNCNTELHGESIDEKSIIVDTVTHRRSRIFFFGGSNSTERHQIPIATVHNAQHATYIATIGNIVLDGVRINVDLFTVKTPEKLIAAAPILQHSSDTTRWGFVPSVGIPLVSEVKNLGHAVKALAHSGSPILAPLNAVTLATETGNLIHDVGQAATALHQASPVAAVNPQLGLTFNVSRTHAVYQTTAESYIRAQEMQVQASEMKSDGIPVQAANAYVNCPVITIAGTPLDSSFRRQELGISANLSATGVLGGSVYGNFSHGHATHYQHSEFTVGTLTLENIKTIELVDADIDADYVVGAPVELLLTSHQDRSTGSGGSVGLGSNLSLTLFASADHSTQTYPSHFHVRDGSRFSVEKLSLTGSEFKAPGARVKSRTETHNHDSTHAVSWGMSLNLDELKSQRNSKPFPIPVSGSFSVQQSAGLDGHLQEEKKLDAHITVPLVDRNSFKMIAQDCQALSHLFYQSDIIIDGLAARSTLGPETEVEDPWSDMPPLLDPTESTLAMLPQVQTNGDIAFYSLLFTIAANMLSDSHEFEWHVLKGAYRVIRDTITEPIKLIYDSGILMVNNAFDGSLLYAHDVHISPESYELAQTRMLAREDAFIQLGSWFLDACVVAGTLGDPAPLSANTIAPYRDAITRFNDSVINTWDHFSDLSSSDKVEALSYSLTSLLFPAAIVKSGPMLMNLGRFSTYPVLLTKDEISASAIPSLYRGSILEPQEVFNTGFTASGTNLDIELHAWAEGESWKESAYISTSLSKREALNFPKNLPIDSKYSFIYEIHTARPSINVLEKLTSKFVEGLIGADDFDVLRHEQERAFQWKLNPHEIKGAWRVDFKEVGEATDEELYHAFKKHKDSIAFVTHWNFNLEHARIITDEYIPNPNYRMPCQTDKKMLGSYGKILSALNAQPRSSAIPITSISSVTKSSLPKIPITLLFVDCDAECSETNKELLSNVVYTKNFH